MFRSGKRPLKKTKKIQNQKNAAPESTEFDPDSPVPISTSVHDNLSRVMEWAGNSPDISLSEFPVTLADGEHRRALLVSLEGMVQKESIHEHVLTPLQKEPFRYSEVRQKIHLQNVSETFDLQEGVQKLFNGFAFLLIEGSNRGWIIQAEKVKSRSIEEPAAETIVRGAHEGFNETISDNVSLLRRRIKHPALRFESFTLGTISRTKVMIAYIDSIADPNLVKQLRDRLQQIEVDVLKSGGELEQYIEDNPYTLFATIGNTERPDNTVKMLNEGRVAILVDGDPMALFVPYFFHNNFQSIEDYNSRPYYASLIRFIRFMAFLFSITLPSFFIVALNFHKEIIPSELIINIAAAREKVPFPLTLEIIIMIIMFEVVREAGIRMPRPIGQAVSIVGALILGEVSVTAGLVGAPTIIVVAFSAIAAFAVTPASDIIGILRLGLIIPSSLFGFYGLIFALLALLTHMVSLTSMGVPFMSPFAPGKLADWKDTIFRFPYTLLRGRKKSIPHGRSVNIHELPFDHKEKVRWSQRKPKS